MRPKSGLRQEYANGRQSELWRLTKHTKNWDGMLAIKLTCDCCHTLPVVLSVDLAAMPSSFPSIKQNNRADVFIINCSSLESNIASVFLDSVCVRSCCKSMDKIAVSNLILSRHHSTDAYLER